MGRSNDNTRNPTAGAVVHLHRRTAASSLRRLRVEFGLTQEQAAALCGVSPRAWGDWERASVPLRSLEAFLLLQAQSARRAA